MDDHEILIFRETLGQLAGLQCLAVGAPASGLPQFSMRFGNPTLSRGAGTLPEALQKTWRMRNEVRLLIKRCSWRMEVGGQIVSGSRDHWYSFDGALIELEGFVNKTVENTVLEVPGCDMTVQFEPGRVLRLFCDSCSEDVGDNYGLFTPTYNAVVMPKGIVTVGRSRPEPRS